MSCFLLMALLSLTAKLLFSLLLWPLAACMAWALAKTAGTLPFKDPRLMSFLGGMAAYGLIQALFWRPLFMYVMGHELTHALAAVLQGGRADHLHVSTKGGQVKVDKSNFIVNLAPYFFPIYTFLLLLVYWVSDSRFRLPLLFLLGASLAFHLALTAYSLRQHQSDITEVGWLFALPFIAAFNFLILAFVLAQALPEAVSLRGYLSLTARTFASFARWTASIF